MTIDNASQAARALTNPALPATDLAAIAYKFPELRTEVALHGSVYPGLLNWLDKLGDDAVCAAVAQRRSRDGIPLPAPNNAYVDDEAAYGRTITRPVVADTSVDDDAIYGHTISRSTLQPDLGASQAPSPSPEPSLVRSPGISPILAQIDAPPLVDTHAQPTMPVALTQMATSTVSQMDYPAPSVPFSPPSPPAAVPPDWDAPVAPTMIRTPPPPPPGWDTPSTGGLVGTPPTPSYPAMPGPAASRAHTTIIGAIIGGLLVLGCGVAEIALYFYQHLAGWIFGVIPGAMSAATHDVGPSNLLKISAYTVGVIWMMLGVIIMTTAKRNLHGVAVFGLIATFLLLVIPACENFIRLRRPVTQALYTWQIWWVLWIVAVPVMIAMAMGLIFALSQSPRLKAGLKVGAIILLMGAFAICVGFSIWHSSVLGGGHIFSAITFRTLIPCGMFALGWLVLLFTIAKRFADTRTPWQVNNQQQTYDQQQFDATQPQTATIARSQIAQPPVIGQSPAMSAPATWSPQPFHQ